MNGEALTKRYEVWDAETREEAKRREERRPEAMIPLQEPKGARRFHDMINNGSVPSPPIREG